MNFHGSKKAIGLIAPSSYKKILAVLAIFLALPGYASQCVKIQKSSVFIPSSIGKARLIHDTKGFAVKQQGKLHRVNSYDVDPQLRKITPAQLAAFMKNDGRLTLSKIGDKDFGVKLAGNLRGGGPIGAAIGAFLGKAAVSVVGHGAILVVSTGAGLVGGPAAFWATGVALESTCGAAIEAYSMTGAVAGGIAGGVATGPI